MKVIFLDIDGVLNYLPDRPRETVPNFVQQDERCYGLNPALVAQLKRIIEATDAKIVISSSWRHFHDYLPYQPKRDWRDVLAERLGMPRKSIIIGETPTLVTRRMDEYGTSKYTLRGREIRQWLEENKKRFNTPITYCILDDEVDDITSVLGKKRVIHVNYKQGLTDSDVTKAIRILTGHQHGNRQDQRS